MFGLEARKKEKMKKKNIEMVNGKLKQCESKIYDINYAIANAKAALNTATREIKADPNNKFLRQTIAKRLKLSMGRLITYNKFLEITKTYRSELKAKLTELNSPSGVELFDESFMSGMNKYFTNMDMCMEQFKGMNSLQDLENSIAQYSDMFGDYMDNETVQAVNAEIDAILGGTTENVATNAQNMEKINNVDPSLSEEMEKIRAAINSN